MILKALYDYYNRCEGLSAKGLEQKEIGYLIVIDKDGTFVRIESRMKDKKTAQTFLVLQTIKRSGRKYAPNILWDNYEYVIGGADESAKKHDTFIRMIEKLKEQVSSDRYLNAISEFYKKNEKLEDIIKNDVLYEEMHKSKKNISFLLQGESKIAAENEKVWNLILSQSADDGIYGICLVTGKKDSVARLHTTIKLTKDTGPLVSFKTDRGYDSYGKEQGYNAQISGDAEFAYTTALNAMLQKGSHNKFSVGNRTFVFWASSNSEAAEQTEGSLFDLLGYTEEEVDDPNAKIEQVRKVFTAIYSGSLKTSLEDRFYILGLAPNSARIAVVYWSECSLKEFAGKILCHFEDMKIKDTRIDKKPYMGIKSMLAAVTLNGKQSEATPNLPEAVVKSIFQGTPYPFTLFSACIRRIRAESGNKDAIRIARMAIIKAYLNRINDNNKKIETMLDKSNTNQGYLCGRLFAVLENLQYAANKQDSIRSGYMNAASSTPSAVYPTILKLSNSHYSKLAKDKKGLAIYFDNQKKEIMAQISDFPDTLDLSDQGRFFLGYYHQKNHEENKETED
ncbi:MAG: type I-C CRISPR-associated protein Cas8c/Csd1 [Escherichia coli]|uniref:Type I-C CRISPR-associated protein Cas8c/Csd1 n=1 Tax=Segatella copri TaxID=165179 RepID=A0AAW5IHW2_9BACT|nr:type I-C CRISPR-associated protein Cas8c/Csd1 [Segatella copri]MBL1007729.1 type I-C CRISPR-associated protein Cas8c/Csd1 [Escherichia coli]MCP9534193.1 type I-C CRISPR-associated protein Cas8c/Csd1 [Segatella copri]MCP9537078.1 type I-C CRISPR-associated protein Cas8c/Csd1 [Segatella copri]MCP9540163.1 type I-C CRISPR-associated protein Cas8c/Csd1 [Segatella copri]MCP9558367.1 type I-C CRISPR-associated protein Cas8c/Csd1 [Segatella copri]